MHDVRRCLLCYANRKGRSRFRGHWGVPRCAKKKGCPFMVRRRHSDDGAMIDLSTPSSPGAWGVQYPALWEFLWATCYDDGEDRQPGSMIVFKDGFKLKACLTDKDASEVAFVTGETPESLFECLEAGLVKNDLDWRPMQKRRK